jgi:hypothetical protein
MHANAVDPRRLHPKVFSAEKMFAGNVNARFAAAAQKLCLAAAV